MEKYDKTRLDKQAIIAQTIENGTQLPAHAKEGFDVAMTRMDAEDDATRQVSTYDSEYAMAGVKDPNVFITTSKDPSSKLKEFVKEIKLIIPNSTRINRGNIQIKQLVETCRSHDVTDLIIVHENRGEPDGMIISHFPYGPTAYFGLYNVVSRHETKTSKTFSENDSSYDEVEDTFIDNGMKSGVTEVTTCLSQSHSQWNIIQPPKQFNTNPLQCVEHQKTLDYPTLEQCVQSVILNSNTKTISFETIYNQTLLQLSSKLHPEATIHYVFVVTLILANKKQYHLLNPSINQLSVKIID
ncbi:hypothetical protein, conserved [Entamoeba histolytica HM-1:IMSS]|uniref:Brix domain-containing protein n=1 Tax=Entamoeba histolytica (strain ATCC 30459 / HM-1:IMSS / ABRM) TaxID=294381 RepID=B1N3M3_ENTH1|nr:hypothetical protein, conserved [Entamoeba histolytica HM-1:IMSS]EDS89434.1 hypothetical protein, conserved [Entamoeba histolytica HM-1:IMSS]|eukprot:XP_001913789.1 hypothetical protein, conserved [Entamoeba histolytica HM-1:IMSS]